MLKLSLAVVATAVMLLSAVVIKPGDVTRALALSPTPGPTAITVYHSPTCQCCGKWIRYLEQQGYSVVSVTRDDMAGIKAETGVPARLKSCHTAVVGRYVIEGHVPVEDIRRLLRDQPAITGLAAAGMPQAAPGMDGAAAPYDVLAFDDHGGITTWAHH